MSVWCSRLILDNTWDEHPSPLVYQGSHILPADADPRAGYVDTAHIPGFITRDGRDDRPEDESVWPYLRLAVGHDHEDRETVVLDAGQVRLLRDDLDAWLRRVKPVPGCGYEQHWSTP